MEALIHWLGRGQVPVNPMEEYWLRRVEMDAFGG